MSRAFLGSFALIWQLILLFGGSPHALAATTARIADTEPSREASLGRGESFHVRIEYTSDEPVSLWARPYLHGRAVQNAMSNASSRHSGEGEALGWFALTGPGEVDEIRIIAGGGEPYREWELARESVRLEWTNAPASAAAPASWVSELQAAAAEQQRADAARRASEPVSGGESLLFGGFMFFILALVVGAIVLSVRTVRKWRGGWRIAAAVPAAWVAFVILRIVLDTARDPTSHNLWPFEILIACGGAVLIIGLLSLVRRFAKA